jgi:predicted nucleotidyltransferase component of viral defense system
VALHPARSPVIVEKDFWVCWALYRLFEIVRFHPKLIFKGGTSLSKAYNAIDRFSEDVDLSLSRVDLGFTDKRDPEQKGIGSKEISRRIEALVSACKESIRNDLLPKIRDDFAGVLKDKIWSVELDPLDPQTIIFVYPSVGLSDGVERYIRPAIRLEMGARSDNWPAADREIMPCVAEVFPEAFKVKSSCQVYTLNIERTFWEKAVLLHKEAHRADAAAKNERMSRHYYDLYMLSRTDVADKALRSRDILERVIEHTTVFFPATWAHYETARPGSFRLLPKGDRLLALKGDYAQMKAMIFGEYPKWEDIVKELTGLEERINAK